MNSLMLFDDADTTTAPVEVDDLFRYRQIAFDYRRILDTSPLANRSLVALKVGARAFDIPCSDLTSRRKGTREIQEIRMKLMAFCRIVSEGHGPHVNTVKTIGRVFSRHHATVIHAVNRYRADIEHALRP